jgi:hypothetical protein
VKGKIVWDNEEKTILRQIYPKDFTVDDIQEMALETYHLLATVPHTVHLILELTSLTRSSQISFMDAASELDATVSRNQGHVVMVGGGLAMQYAAKTIALSAPRATENSHFVDTLDEARELLKRLTAN